MHTTYETPEAVLALSKTDPEYAAITASNPLPHLPWDDVPELRAWFALSRATVPRSGVTQHIPMRDGFQSEIRIHKPTEPPVGGSPLIVLFFGGGFCVGDNNQMTPYAIALSKVYGATVVNISYRLAPEHKFPIGHNDAWDSVMWLGANAASLGADPKAGFILGGVSAGGNLAAITTQKALDAKIEPRITGVWLSIPVLLSPVSVPDEYKSVYLSRAEHQHTDVLDAKAIRDSLDVALSVDHGSPDWSVFNRENAHVGMPPTYFQVAGQDPLRDDALIYEQVLRKYGVKTNMDVYPGVPHGHTAYLPSISPAKKASVDSVIGIGWLLSRTARREDIVKLMVPPTAA